MQRVSTRCGVFFDVPAKRQQLKELGAQIEKPDFWNDRETAQKVLKRHATLERQVKQYESFRKQLDDLLELLELGGEDEELGAELVQEVESFARALDRYELMTTLSAPEDPNDAIMAIHPGAGGTESQDWAEMLFRMYTRYAEREEFKVQVLDLLPGEEAGIKSVTMRIAGEYAYGYLKGETGVHRLVRISPFDANARRHTSFASVFVYPDIDDSIEVEINPSDLRIDTYRSSGAGGQHVNTTDSAVRITHLPTGIIVQCQNERSQHRNREMAMKILRARLYDLRLREQESERDRIHKQKKEIAWGSQIRSYVLQPYRLVKDHRTSFETGKVDDFLDGDIRPAIESYLRWRGARDQHGEG